MNDDFTLAILGFLFGTLVGLGLGVTLADFAWKSNLAEFGYAQYCPTTGDWAWAGECEE